MNYLKGQPPKEKAIAYCHYPEHLGYLSPAIMKNHKCLERECKYLHKYEEHEYWQKKKRKNDQKRFRKWLENDDYEKIAEYIAELIGRKYEQERPET